MKDNTIQSTIVVDANLMLVGRLSSNVAKLLINKNKVIVVNADEALFSGNKKSIVNKFVKRLEIGSITHPRHNPKHYKTSPGILKRVIRGMIPRDKPSGITALKILGYTRVHLIMLMFLILYLIALQMHMVFLMAAILMWVSIAVLY